MDDHPPPSHNATATPPDLLTAARAFLNAFGGNVPAWLRAEADQLEAAIARKQFAFDLRDQNDPHATGEERNAAKARAQAYLDRRAA